MNANALKSSNSPHLALTLDQFAKSGDFDEPQARNILVSFETSVSKSGSQEIGFARETGQSFNPRAARILLILLKDAQLRDVRLLTLAADLAGRGEGYNQYLHLEEPLIVSAAFLLDRLRHLHLEQNVNAEPVYCACLQAAQLLPNEFDQIRLLLTKGVERMKRSLG